MVFVCYMTVISAFMRAPSVSTSLTEQQKENMEKDASENSP